MKNHSLFAPVFNGFGLNTNWIDSMLAHVFVFSIIKIFSDYVLFPPCPKKGGGIAQAFLPLRVRFSGEIEVRWMESKLLLLWPLLLMRLLRMFEDWRWEEKEEAFSDQTSVGWWVQKKEDEKHENQKSIYKINKQTNENNIEKLHGFFLAKERRQKEKEGKKIESEYNSSKK